MSYESHVREVALAQLAKICEPYELRYAQAAFDGDVEAAGMLAVSLKNDKRGAVLVALWRAKVRREAFREYFISAWEHDYGWVVDAAKNRRTLAHMFRYAAFPLPADLPDVVTLWRGTSKLAIAEASKGFSWTTDRDTACWFAMRFADLNGSQLVLTADVAKANIVLFHTGRNESEAVLMRPPLALAIDGDVTDWQARHEAVQNNRKRVCAAQISFAPA